jgi:hypothetical protein
LPRHYSIVLHNLAGFDADLFFKKLDGKITCIHNTDEKYISFSREVLMETKYDKNGKEYAVNRELRFVDSFKFMASSLRSLLKNVKEFPHPSHIYQGEQLELLLKKGVYPYEWVDSPERFNETRLPPKEAFRSKLSGEDWGSDFPVFRTRVPERVIDRVPGYPFAFGISLYVSNNAMCEKLRNVALIGLCSRFQLINEQLTLNCVTQLL